MKLILLKDNLKTGLLSVERAVGTGISLPILKNILLKTQSGKLKIAATNLELGINRFVNSKIIEEGAITIPFEAFFVIISNSDSERIQIETEKNNLLVKTDNYNARIQGSPEAEFPIIPTINNQKNNLDINGATLKTALNEVVSAAQLSEIRPEISGVLFDFQITFLKFVATDSFRLAEKTIFDRDYKTNLTQGFKIIVPLKTIQEIIRTLDEDQETKIIIDQNQILFKNQNQEILSRLIDGQYPDYEQIIPKKAETEIILPKEKFLSAIKLVGSMSSKNNDIKLGTQIGAKTLEIYSANQYIGENNYIIPSKINGPEFKNLTFNWRFLTEGIKNIKSELISMSVNGDIKPTVIKSTEDQSYLYIVMPIKTP